MALNDRVVILREAVIKVTQMLAGGEVKVTQQGLDAYVVTDAKTHKPVRVNLPYLPDNAPDDLCDAIQGFLDHEVGHILETDWVVWGQAVKDGMVDWLNIVEDPRVETRMAKRFQGCGSNLANTGEFFLKKYTQPKLEEAIAKGDTAKIQGLLMVPLIRAMSGQRVFRDFMADKMHMVEETYDKIKDLEPTLEGCESTADALKTVVEIKKRLKEESSPAPGKGAKGTPPPPPPKGSKGEKAPKGATPRKAPKPPADPDEEEEEEKTPPSAVGEEGEPGDPDEEGEPGADEGEGEGEGEAIAGEDDENETESDDEVTSLESSGTMAEIERELANSFDKAVSRTISDEAYKEAKDADYLPFTKDHDVIEPLVVGSGYRPEMLKAVEDATAHMVGPLQKDLERAIAARSLSQWSAGHRSGRLHSANLSRLIVGDDRVFRRREESRTKDVAVELVVDMSGSMSGSKIHIASQTAFALSAVLERLQIANEVIAFTTGRECGSEAERDEARKTSKRIGGSFEFSRTEQIYMPIVKGFQERHSTGVKSRFGWLPNCGNMRNNIDGESLQYAHRRLMSRKETGKIMIVLSDGAPAGAGDWSALDNHLRNVVKDIGKSGVKVIGIGIESSAVQKYYPKYIVLNNMADLASTVIKELRTLLLQN